MIFAASPKDNQYNLYNQKDGFFPFFFFYPESHYPENTDSEFILNIFYMLFVIPPVISISHYRSVILQNIRSHG